VAVDSRICGKAGCLATRQRSITIICFGDVCVLDRLCDRSHPGSGIRYRKFDANSCNAGSLTEVEGSYDDDELVYSTRNDTIREYVASGTDRLSTFERNEESNDCFIPDLWPVRDLTTGVLAQFGRDSGKQGCIWLQETSCSGGRKTSD